MCGPWGRVDGRGWVDQGGGEPAPVYHGHGRGDSSTDLGAVPPRGLIEENSMPQRQLTHTVRQIEQICPGCWEVRTQTEDGHRFTAFGVTRKQAMYRAHQKARACGRYAYPTMPRASE